MRVLLWAVCLALVLGALLATTLQAEDTRALQYRWCWCVKMDESYACRGQLVARTCWEVPLCREPLPVGDRELECWRRQRAIGKELRPGN